MAPLKKFTTSNCLWVLLLLAVLSNIRVPNNGSSSPVAIFAISNEPSLHHVSRQAIYHRMRQLVQNQQAARADEASIRAAGSMLHRCFAQETRGKCPASRQSHPRVWLPGYMNTSRGTISGVHRPLEWHGFRVSHTSNHKSTSHHDRHLL